MSMIYHERPGVYSDYEASSVTATAAASMVVGVAAAADADPGLYTLTSYGAAAAAFGENSELTQLCRLLYQNGAGTVLAAPVTASGNYAAALARITDQHQARLLVIGSGTAADQQTLLEAVQASTAARCECIGLCGMENPTAAALIARAAQLNSERMVLVGPGVFVPEQTDAVSGAYGAAALAGVLAAQSDPAQPLNGASLAGLSGVTARYDDTALDSLIRGGVTVLEAGGVQPSVIRGVTTRTKTGGATDTTYREVNTVLIIDEVIPAIRTALRSRFARAKNNAVTRGAIRTQVQVELESRVEREIIDSYSAITVAADPTDPTVCLVDFGFTVTHGLSRIYLTAHISV